MKRLVIYMVLSCLPLLSGMAQVRHGLLFGAGIGFENLEMDTHSAKELHKKMQYYTYSMAVMIATGYRNISEEEMDRELTDIFKIILRHYKKIDNEEECDYWLERARNLPE